MHMAMTWRGWEWNQGEQWARPEWLSVAVETGSGAKPHTLCRWNRASRVRLGTALTLGSKVTQVCGWWWERELEVTHETEGRPRAPLEQTRAILACLGDIQAEMLWRNWICRAEAWKAGLGWGGTFRTVHTCNRLYVGKLWDGFRSFTMNHSVTLNWSKHKIYRNVSSLRNLDASTHVNLDGARNGKHASSDRRNRHFMKRSY